jgi:hypothetical protein
MIKITNELIEQLLNENESSTLDFKGSQYKFIKASEVEKSELLKDILAFANAFRRTDAFILIGVKEVKGSRAEVVGTVETLDDASIQQFVNSKTQRPVEFLFETFSFEGKKICIIQISIQERPRYLLQDFGELKKEKVYIRRGTSTDEASPDEISQMNFLLNKNIEYTPDLNIKFNNDLNTESFTINSFKRLSEDDLQNQLTQYKYDNPHRWYEDFKNSKQLFPFPTPTSNQIDEYNAYLDECYNEYGIYLKQKYDFLNEESGKIELKLKIINIGTLPAEDIDIFLVFPNGFELYEKNKLLKEPKAQNSPMNISIYCSPLRYVLPNILNKNLDPIPFPLINVSNIHQHANVSLPKIRKINSYEVKFHIDKLKHNQSELLSSLYIVFRSYEDVCPFNINYKIQAANVPNEINGNLFVNIKK